MSLFNYGGDMVWIVAPKTILMHWKATNILISAGKISSSLWFVYV